MDAMTLVLALAVVTAIVGQLLLVVTTRWLRERSDKRVAEARARLVEDAADRLLQTRTQHIAKLDSKNKGVPDAY